MKSSASFAIGLVVGAGSALAVVFTFFLKTPPPPAGQAVPPDNSRKFVDHPPLAPVQNEVLKATELSDQNFQTALHEIGEAGMVVVPQELLGFYTPGFVFGRTIYPNIQHTFRLDSRELAVLNDARLHFERAIMDAANLNLEIAEANAELLEIKTTMLPEQRTQLIDAMRAEILRGLDEDSAALFAYLDMEKAIGPANAGLKNATVRVRRVPGVPNFQVTVSDGSFTRVTSMTRELLAEVYPGLRDYLPAQP